jgi:hypothetical protein
MSETLKVRLEKVIAGTMFASNPDMSGDPRRRLLPHQRRKVEDCVHAVLEEMREPDDQALDAVGYGRESMWRADFRREYRKLIKAAIGDPHPALAQYAPQED